jgi:ketosteroid isomerase-like protein
MTVHPNVQLLRNYLAAHEQRHGAALTALFAADARW